MDLFRVTQREKRIMKIVLWFSSIFWIFPAYSALSRSFLFNGFKNYLYVFTSEIGGVTIYRTFVNSFFVAACHAIIVVSVAAISGYAFSKIYFKGKEIIYLIVIASMAVPVTAIIAPLFFTLTRTGLYDTYAAIFMTEAALSLPFSVLMLRNYFDGLPSELMESAFIDGANHFQIFTKIYLPLSSPALINLSVLAFMWSFKDFVVPALFTTKPELMTATLAISRFKDYLGSTPKELGRYNAALVLLAIPTIIIFTYVQKYMRRGLVAGALKG